MLVCFASRWLLGGKGANLAEMAGIGLNIPPGFTLTTEVTTLKIAPYMCSLSHLL
jgi:phosphoenolpyruvate synthase/pyruvate phosphate dikinase